MPARDMVTSLPKELIRITSLPALQRHLGRLSSCRGASGFSPWPSAEHLENSERHIAALAVHQARAGLSRPYSPHSWPSAPPAPARLQAHPAAGLLHIPCLLGHSVVSPAMVRQLADHHIPRE